VLPSRSLAVKVTSWPGLLAADDVSNSFMVKTIETMAPGVTIHHATYTPPLRSD